jgi:hypothetical protein
MRQRGLIDAIRDVIQLGPQGVMMKQPRMAKY